MALVYNAATGQWEDQYSGSPEGSPNPYRPSTMSPQGPEGGSPNRPPAPGSAGPGSYPAPPGFTYDPTTGTYHPTQPLPPGASFDPQTGQITYQPGAPGNPTVPGLTLGPVVGPAPPPGGPGGPRVTGATPGSAPTPFDWPTFTAPPFVPATGPTAPPPFSHPDFVAPTLADAKNQPGYQFGFDQGTGAIQTSAAAKGLLRGGGTLKSLFDYGNAAAEQNYANVYAQNATTYNTNLAKDVGTYATNWGVTKDVSSLGNAANQSNYQNAFQNAGAEFNPKYNASILSFQDMYNRWLANLNSLTNIATAGAA